MNTAHCCQHALTAPHLPYNEIFAPREHRRLLCSYGGVERPQWVSGGGASNSSDGYVTHRATLGQPMVGSASGGDVTVEQCAGYGTATGYNPSYLA